MGVPLVFVIVPEMVNELCAAARFVAASTIRRHNRRGPMVYNAFPLDYLCHKKAQKA
jgi:hypothetical protein